MIDLVTLATVTGIAPESAEPLALRCAIALQRRHRPGVGLTCDMNGRTISEKLYLRGREHATSAHEDWNRVTEEGAEAIALMLASLHHSLRIKRRLQSRFSEGADWLLTNSVTGAKVVLEVGGTDEGDLGVLLSRKIAQAKRSPFATRGRAAACVVCFAEPEARLWSDDEPR